MALTIAVLVAAVLLGAFLINRGWEVLGGMFMGPASVLLAIIAWIFIFGGG